MVAHGQRAASVFFSLSLSGPSSPATNHVALVSGLLLSENVEFGATLCQLSEHSENGAAYHVPYVSRTRVRVRSGAPWHGVRDAAATSFTFP